MASADLLGEGEFGVVEINGDDCGAYTGPQAIAPMADGAAADDGHLDNPRR